MLAEAATATTNRPTIVAALQQAAAATGADFNYLLGTATRESSLNPSAQAGTSSAAGLFQFVEQTWLGVVKTYGAKHGLGSFANAITQGPDGRFRTSNSADRSAILALRKDPQVASLMEGEFAQATRSQSRRLAGPQRLRRRALCRALSRHGCRLPPYPHERQPAQRERGKLFPGRGRRQPQCLLPSRWHAPRPCAKSMTGR